MRNQKTLAILNILGILAALTLNGLANGLPINGYNTGEISAMYPNEFVPAGLTFSIWGVIYLQLIAFGVWGAIQGFKGRGEFLERTGLWFFISCLANASWIVAWHHLLLEISVLIMLVLLVSLMMMYGRLNIGRRKVSLAEKIVVNGMVSIYLGWISVATIANITAWLVHQDWQGFGISEPTWALVMVIVAISLSFIMIANRNDPVYGLAIAWALVGIWVKQNMTNPEPTRIAYVALAGGILVGVAFFISIFRKRVYIRRE